MPIITTEPAVGNGLGLAAVHFHDAGKDTPSTEQDSHGRTTPRSISTLALGGTENGTKFAGGGHFGHYKLDTIRYESILGYADVFMDFYGPINQPIEKGASFNTEAAALMQLLAFRLGESNWFAGGAYRFLNTDTRFKLGTAVPGITSDSLQSNNAAVAVVVRYDSLGNQFTPIKGLHVTCKLRALMNLSVVTSTTIS